MLWTKRRPGTWTLSGACSSGAAALVEPLGEALERVYANIIKQGSPLPPPVDWHPAEE